MEEFDAVLEQNGTMNAAYIRLPFDVKERYGRGRLPVHVLFDGVEYDGQAVRMQTPFWLIGVNQKIRKELHKTFGDTVHVCLWPKETARQKKIDPER